MKKPEVIEIDTEIFPIIFEALKVKNPKCIYCEKKVDKNNVSGVWPSHIKGDHTPRIVCNSTVCLIFQFHYEEEHYDTPSE